jgi:hypothetical protein
MQIPVNCPALDPRAKAAAPASQGRAALTGARDRRALARESESSPKLRRELFEIVLQEEILLAAR